MNGAVGLLILATAACKHADSTAKASLKAPAPIASVWRFAPTDGIEKYVKPAASLSGLGANMTGVWYCRANAGQLGLSDGAVLMSFANAKQSSSAGPGGTVDTYSFGTYEPLNYAFNPKVTPYSSISDKDKIDAMLYLSYDVVFDGAKTGHLVIYTSPGGKSPRVRADPSHYSFTLDWIADNHWLRKSSQGGKAMAPYDLLRIVNADGTPDPVNYPLYLDDMRVSQTPYVVIAVKDGTPLATADLGVPDNSIASSGAATDWDEARVPGSNGDMTRAGLADAVTVLSE